MITVKNTHRKERYQAQSIMFSWHYVRILYRMAIDMLNLVIIMGRLTKDPELTVTGILIDSSDSGCGESLKPFCNRIYRTSTTDSDDIVADLLRRIDDGEAA